MKYGEIWSKRKFDSGMTWPNEHVFWKLFRSYLVAVWLIEICHSFQYFGFQVKTQFVVRKVIVVVHAFDKSQPIKRFNLAAIDAKFQTCSCDFFRSLGLGFEKLSLTLTYFGVESIVFWKERANCFSFNSMKPRVAHWSFISRKIRSWWKLIRFAPFPYFEKNLTETIWKWEESWDDEYPLGYFVVMILGKIWKFLIFIRNKKQVITVIFQRNRRPWPGRRWEHMLPSECEQTMDKPDQHNLLSGLDFLISSSRETKIEVIKRLN